MATPLSVPVFDTFTDSDSTVLSSHTGQVGATWTKHASFTSLQTITGNRVHGDGAGFTVYYASGTPASPEYDVIGTVHNVTNVANDQTGVVGRVATGANTMYRGNYFNNSAFFLQKAVAGTVTNLGSYTASLTTNEVRLRMRGSALALNVDGVERVTATDTAITAAGLAGTMTRFSNTTVGYHLADIRVDDTFPTGQRNLIYRNTLLRL